LIRTRSSQRRPDRADVLLDAISRREKYISAALIALVCFSRRTRRTTQPDPVLSRMKPAVIEDTLGPWTR
jgi:hypothetical protein